MEKTSCRLHTIEKQMTYSIDTNQTKEDLIKNLIIAATALTLINAAYSSEGVKKDESKKSQELSKTQSIQGQSKKHHLQATASTGTSNAAKSVKK